MYFLSDEELEELICTTNWAEFTLLLTKCFLGVAELVFEHDPNIATQQTPEPQETLDTDKSKLNHQWERSISIEMEGGDEDTRDVESMDTRAELIVSDTERPPQLSIAGIRGAEGETVFFKESLATNHREHCVEAWLIEVSKGKTKVYSLAPEPRGF